jgi:prevent-host-death family protein
MKVNILEAKNNLSHLIRSAQAGEDVVIANRGVPVARLVAIGPAQSERAADAGVGNPTRPSAGSGRALLDWLRAHPLPQRLRRDPIVIDRAVAEERAAWD